MFLMYRLFGAVYGGLMFLGGLLDRSADGDIVNMIGRKSRFFRPFLGSEGYEKDTFL